MEVVRGVCRVPRGYSEKTGWLLVPLNELKDISSIRMTGRNWNSDWKLTPPAPPVSCCCRCCC